jgi:hypothetical protein
MSKFSPERNLELENQGPSFAQILADAAKKAQRGDIVGVVDDLSSVELPSPDQMKAKLSSEPTIESESKPEPRDPSLLVPEEEPAIADKPASPEPPVDSILETIKKLPDYDALVFYFSDPEHSLWKEDHLLLATDMQNALIAARGLLERGGSLEDATTIIEAEIDSRTVRAKALELLEDLSQKQVAKEKTKPAQKRGLFSFFRPKDQPSASSEAIIAPVNPDVKPEQLAETINSVATYQELLDLVARPEYALAKNGQPLDMDALRQHLREAWEQIQKGKLSTSPSGFDLARQNASAELLAIDSQAILNKAKELLEQEMRP